MEKIQKGDIVVLKSGSPDMTVAWCEVGNDGNQNVTCSWFVGGELKNATFNEVQLELAAS